jgi:XTP/dITP diphosphohydrolase
LYSCGVKILIASNNAHKLQEFSEIFELAGAGDVRLLTPRDLGLSLDPEESAQTYVGNALIKARAFRAAVRRTHGSQEISSLQEMKSLDWILADDSGLEVDALDGRPGLLSARYHKAAPGGDGCAALIAELSGVPDMRRTARFRAVLAFAAPAGDREYLFEGVCEGAIAHEQRGVNGFGFDPVFLVNAERCMAELASSDKHAVSHRGVVTRKAIDVLGLRPATQPADPDVARARAVKARHEAALLKLPGVVGVGGWSGTARRPSPGGECGASRRR